MSAEISLCRAHQQGGRCHCSKGWLRVSRRCSSQHSQAGITYICPHAGIQNFASEKRKDSLSSRRWTDVTGVMGWGYFHLRRPKIFFHLSFLRKGRFVLQYQRQNTTSWTFSFLVISMENFLVIFLFASILILGRVWQTHSLSTLMYSLAEEVNTTRCIYYIRKMRQKLKL